MNIRKIIREEVSRVIDDNINDNFWNWFGDSKVVSGGEPVVVYHGTDIDFDVFDKEKIGFRHWQSVSNAYGGGFFFTDKKDKAPKLGVIKEVFLKLENPLIRKLEDRYGSEVDYYHATDMYDNNPTNFLRDAKENGNDGIIISTPRGSIYVAFEPNQIKSVNNDGTWDSNDDNIYS